MNPTDTPKPGETPKCPEWRETLAFHFELHIHNPGGHSLRACVRPNNGGKLGAWFWERWPWLGHCGWTDDLDEAKRLAGAPWIPCETPRTGECTCSNCGYTWKRGAHGGHSCVDRLLWKVATLEREIAELQRDRERLRWLNDNWRDFLAETDRHQGTGSSLHAAIDRAMQPKEENKP